MNNYTINQAVASGIKCRDMLDRPKLWELCIYSIDYKSTTFYWTLYYNYYNINEDYGNPNFYICRLNLYLDKTFISDPFEDPNKALKSCQDMVFWKN